MLGPTLREQLKPRLADKMDGCGFAWPLDLHMQLWRLIPFLADQQSLTTCILPLPLSPSTPQLASDPALRQKLARLSTASFARLVELFSSREGSRTSPSLPCPGPPPPSPEPLARLALAMELSRRVAHLGGTLAGLSVEHVHSFAPWIQAHGGWVSRGMRGASHPLCDGGGADRGLLRLPFRLHRSPPGPVSCAVCSAPLVLCWNPPA